MISVESITDTLSTHFLNLLECGYKMLWISNYFAVYVQIK